MSVYVRDGAGWGYVGLTMKSNQRQKFIEETGAWEEENVYGRFIHRLEQHFRDEDLNRQNNDEHVLTMAIDLNPEEPYYLFELAILYYVQKIPTKYLLY